MSTDTKNCQMKPPQGSPGWALGGVGPYAAAGGACACRRMRLRSSSVRRPKCFQFGILLLPPSHPQAHRMRAVFHAISMRNSKSLLFGFHSLSKRDRGGAVEVSLPTLEARNLLVRASSRPLLNVDVEFLSAAGSSTLRAENLGLKSDAPWPGVAPIWCIASCCNPGCSVACSASGGRLLPMSIRSAAPCLMPGEPDRHFPAAVLGEDCAQGGSTCEHAAHHMQ